MTEFSSAAFFLSRFIYLITNVILLYIFLTPKRLPWVQVVAFSATFIIVYFLRDLLNPIISDPFILGYLLGSLYFIPCILLFKESFHAKLFVFFMIFSLSQFNFLIFTFLEQLLFSKVSGGLILSGLVMEAASLPLIKRYVAPHIKNIINITHNSSFSFTFFPMLSFLLLAYYGVQRSYLLHNFLPLVLNTLLIMFTYYLIAMAIFQTKHSQQVENQLALQREHYRSLNDSINTVKIIRHDLRHHIVTCLELFAKNNPAAAELYLSGLCDQYDDTTIPKVCANQSADALISHYLKLAKHEGIKLNTSLNLPEDLTVADQDLCVILGNCLENAFEGCKKLSVTQSRFINLKTTISKGHLLIKIDNSFNGLAIVKDNGFASSKIGSEHGFGLSSIKALTTKYHGYCSISYEQAVFNVSICIKLPEVALELNDLTRRIN